MTRNGSETLSLADAASRLLDECRMVLPGIQALFGFQLIAVFNDRFKHDLPHQLQVLHIIAIFLVGVSVGLIMTPAAYHRQITPQRVTETFLRISSRLLLISMVPLLIAISSDLYVVSFLVVERTFAAWLTGAIFIVLAGLWFLLPRTVRR